MNPPEDEALREKQIKVGSFSKKEIYPLLRKVMPNATDAMSIASQLSDWHDVCIARDIAADRKRVALEARIDENNMYIRELTRHYFPSSPSEPHIPLVQFHERIAELKAQQEEV